MDQNIAYYGKEMPEMKMDGKKYHIVLKQANIIQIWMGNIAFLNKHLIQRVNFPINVRNVKSHII